MEDQKNQGLGKLFVSYEIAKKLDYLQFNEECLAFFDEDNNLQIGGSFKNSSMLKGFTAPLYQQVIDWFRETEGFYIEVVRYDVGHFEYQIKSNMATENSKHTFPTYYEALNKAIEEALKLI